MYQIHTIYLGSELYSEIILINPTQNFGIFTQYLHLHLTKESVY